MTAVVGEESSNIAGSLLIHIILICVIFYLSKAIKYLKNSMNYDQLKEYQ